MLFIMNLNYKVANLRYKLWRLSGKILLGKLFGAGFGQKVTRDIDEACGNPAIRSHVLERTLLASSYIQKYDFDNSFSVEFPRDEIFRQRNVYLLKDVVLGPKYGGVWIPNNCFFQQSIGSIRRTHSNISISETLLPINTIYEDSPILGIGVFSHYHMLLEAIPLLLHAIKFYPNLKLLLPVKYPKYLRLILETLRIDESRLILSDKPIKTEKAILVPKHETSGFIPREDLDILRNFFEQYIDKTNNKYPDKIYISRTKSVNRQLVGEKNLEIELQNLDFEIVYFEELTLPEQFSYIYNAKVIVAPHGAGLANLIIAQPGTKVLEILSRNWFNTCYAKLAVQLGLEYTFAETKIVNNQTIVDVKFVVEKINNLL